VRCKYCNSDSTNGTNFCSRKHRILWIREHNIKGGKRKAEQAYERELMSWGLVSSALDANSVGHY